MRDWDTAKPLSRLFAFAERSHGAEPRREQLDIGDGEMRTLTGLSQRGPEKRQPRSAGRRSTVPNNTSTYSSAEYV